MANFDVETKKKLDARLAVDPYGKEFIIDVAGAQVTPRVEPATSLSNSTINFNITPNSPTSVLDRSIIVATKVKFVFTGDGSQPAGSPILEPGRSAPRGFNYGVQSSTITLNGLSISQETQAIMHALSHFSEADNMVHKQSISPSWMAADYVQEYTDVGAETTMNTLAAYKDSTRARFGKGCYDIELVGLMTATAAEVDVTFYEYLTLSPANYNGNKMPGLTNVTSLQLTFVLANLERMWAQARENITNLQVTIVESACHFQELSFPVYLSVPPVVTYSYTDIQRQTSSRNQQIAVGATAQLSSNSYQLNTVPHSIIVYAKERESDLYASAASKTNRTDAYGVIEKLEIQYNNQSAILSSASQIQLFQMSARNGVDLSWQEFNGRSPLIQSVLVGGNATIDNLALGGSLICLSFGSDISANDPASIPGVSINSNFQVRATVKNTANRDIYYDLTVLYCYEGILSVSPGSAYRYVSLLTKDEGMNLEIDDETASGGKMDFSGIIEKAKTGLKKAAPFLKPIASKALDVAADFGSQYVPTTELRKGIKTVTGLGLQSQGAGLQGGQLQPKSRMAMRM